MRHTRVTDAELALLNELWARGQATIRQLTDAVYPAGTDSQYATVQKLLGRLEAKGLVVRDRGTKAHRFRPTVSRDDFVGHRLQALADKLCSGSLTPLLTSLIQEGELSSDDRETLRVLVQELEKKPTTNS